MREAHRQWLTPAGLGRGRSRRQRPRGRRESAAHAPAQHPARSGPSRAGRSATNPAAAEYMNRPGGNVQPGLASSPAQHRAIECAPGSGTPARCQAKTGEHWPIPVHVPALQDCKSWTDRRNCSEARGNYDQRRRPSCHFVISLVAAIVRSCLRLTWAL